LPTKASSISPPFSLGRAQELLYELDKIGLKVPVFAQELFTGKRDVGADTSRSVYIGAGCSRKPNLVTFGG